MLVSKHEARTVYHLKGTEQSPQTPSQRGEKPQPSEEISSAIRASASSTRTADRGGARIEWAPPIIKKADKLGIPVFLKKELLRLYPELPHRKEVPWLPKRR